MEQLLTLPSTSHANSNISPACSCLILPTTTFATNLPPTSLLSTMETYIFFRHYLLFCWFLNVDSVRLGRIVYFYKNFRNLAASTLCKGMLNGNTILRRSLPIILMFNLKMNGILIQ
jgi:hypothetical protein